MFDGGDDDVDGIGIGVDVDVYVLSGGGVGSKAKAGLVGVSEWSGASDFDRNCQSHRPTQTWKERMIGTNRHKHSSVWALYGLV